jgi:hypothetical protein
MARPRLILTLYLGQNEEPHLSQVIATKNPCLRGLLTHCIGTAVSRFEKSSVRRTLFYRSQRLQYRYIFYFYGHLFPNKALTTVFMAVL